MILIDANIASVQIPQVSYLRYLAYRVLSQKVRPTPRLKSSKPDYGAL